MTTSTIFELIGYLGSLLVIVSMLMTSVVKLRIINTIGSVIFAVYALLIHSYPTAAMQFCLIIINIVGLYKLLGTKKDYSVVELNPDEKFVQTFLSQNIDDIKKFFPNFKMPEQSDNIYYIHSKNTSVGILIGKKSQTENSTLFVSLDYTIPAYRDTSAGAFLYSQLGQMGIETLEARADCEAHKKYLQKMGFKFMETSGLEPPAYRLRTCRSTR